MNEDERLERDRFPRASRYHPECPYCLHSADWWRRHWQRTGIVSVSVADELDDGTRYWRDWITLVAPNNTTEIQALDTDAGHHLADARVIGQRNPAAERLDPNLSLLAEYQQQPLQRD